MSRKIKFRAWNGSNMFYSHSVCIMIDGGIAYLDTDGEWKGDDDGSVIKLMQYTGLKDKNGVEIYEADIIKTNTGIGFIIWFGVQWAIESPGSEAVDTFYINDTYEWEVLGNIHQHQHLLNPQSHE